jgi:hypothetical protein
MKTRTVIFVAVVVLIIAALIYSKVDDLRICESTKISAGNYKKNISEALEQNDENKAISLYGEFRQCFGEEKKQSALEIIVDYFRDEFVRMQQEQEYDEIVTKFRQAKLDINDQDFEMVLYEPVFVAYFSRLEQYEAEIGGANFVLNTTATTPACIPYLIVYDQMLDDVPDVEKRAGIREIEETAQFCYILKANKFRFDAQTPGDIDAAIQHYQTALSIEIVNPASNHAQKVIQELRSCTQQKGTCVPKELKQECLEIIGPSSGFDDCTALQICCEALV